MDKLLLRTKRVAATLTLASLFVVGAGAQQKVTVKGSVVDEAGEPIIGATVMEGSSSNGTITDLDGNFVINVTGGNATLKVSYIGMSTQTVKLSGAKKTLKVVMRNDDHNLNEVVVVGYGQQKKASVVGSITQTTGKVL